MLLNDNRYFVKITFQCSQPISYNWQHWVNNLSLSFKTIGNSITNIRLESKNFNKSFFPLFLCFKASSYIYIICDPSPTKQDVNCLNR